MRARIGARNQTGAHIRLGRDVIRIF